MMDTKVESKEADGPKVIFVLGGAGTSAGEHGTKLASDLGFKRLAMGELLREEGKFGGALGEKIKEYMEPRQLVPDDIVLSVLKKAIGRHKERSYLFEGFPKTIAQGLAIENLIGECQLLLHLTAPFDVLLKNAITKEDLMNKEQISADEIVQRIEMHHDVVKPVINYYAHFAKVREVDCTGSLSEVHARVLHAILPQVYMTIGPKASGKTSVSQYLAKRTDMKHLDFLQFASRKEFRRIRTDPGKITQELIKAIQHESCARVIIDGFPESARQLEYYLANAPCPDGLVVISCSEEQCLAANRALGPKHPNYLSPVLLLNQLREFLKLSKDIVSVGKKRGIVMEVANSEKKQLKSLLEEAGRLLEPEIVLGRCHEKSQEALAEMVTELVSKDEYMHLDAAVLRREECARKTRAGREILRYASQGKIVPSHCTTDILRKIIHSGSGFKKFVVTGFPEEVQQLKEFEEGCGRIAWEFYLYPDPEEILGNYSGYSIETYMHAQNRFTAMPVFNIDLVEQYYGVHLQYVLVHGPKLSGKSTIAKSIAEHCGYTLMDYAGISDELKKKLSTEENPPEGITVTFEQVLDHLVNRLANRANRKEKYVLDVFPVETKEQAVALINAMGMPTHYLELECPIEMVKGRYKIANGVADLGEDQVAELEKGYELYEEIKKELSPLREQRESFFQEIKNSMSIDKSIQEVKSIFEARIVLVKLDSAKCVVPILYNLSIKYGFLFVDTTTLIKDNIEKGTEIGRELNMRKKQKELRPEYATSEQLEYCAVHFDFDLVVKLVKESILQIRSNQSMILITGLMDSHKLLKQEDAMEVRPMDQLFAIDSVVGNIKAIINLTMGEFEKTEDVRKAEFPPKPEVKVEEKKEVEGDDAEENKGNEEEAEKDAKPVFKAEEYAWTSTEGEPRTVGQLFASWKKCVNKNMQLNEFQTEGLNFDLIFDKILWTLISGELSSHTSYVQVKFSSS